MKHLLLLSALLCALSASGQRHKDIASPGDTIITKTQTVIEVNKATNDTILKTTVTEEIRKIATEENGSYMIDENNNRVSFFWDAAKKNKGGKKLSAHWSGFGAGFLNYSNSHIPHGELNMGASLNFTFNFMTISKQLGQSNFILFTGLGTEWAKYKFNDNAALTKVDGITQFLPAPEGVNYVSSKMTVYHITVPLMLEFQKSDFHFSFGAIGMFKWHSKSQTRYYEEVMGGKVRHKETQGKDLNILPVNLRLKAQIGIKNIALYGYYDPISMFKDGKGPKLRSYAIGAMLLF